MNIFSIGGVGGSGTRLIAQCLKELGCYIGGDLNPVNDNLWFTLLFKRLDILEASDQDIKKLWEIFVKGMVGIPCFEPHEIELLNELAKYPRLQQDIGWLEKRVTSLLNAGLGACDKLWWGWKEPNTHVVIERLYALNPTLRYIHVMRHGLDMAYSSNQNQAQLWGKLFTGVDYAASPRYSLKYWCAVHKKINLLSGIMKDNFFLLNFDEFCLKTEKEVEKLLGFLGVDNTAVNQRKVIDLVGNPRSIGRYRGFDLGLLDGKDIAYVNEMGFDISP